MLTKSLLFIGEGSDAIPGTNRDNMHGRMFRAFDKTTGQARPLDTRLATMKVSYDPHLQMNEEGRIENPLGFRVHSYRVDPEVSGTTPPHVPVPVPSSSPPVESAGAWPTVADPALTGNTALPMQTGGTHAARM